MASRSAPRAIPYFSHPLEVAAILTDLKLDDATIAAALLHDTIEDTDGHARRDRPAVRPRDRHAGRGPDQAEEARPRHQGGQAGGEPAQAAAGDRRRRARAAGQARRPAAQHAHARLHAGRRRAAASPRRRWTSMRRSPAAWACRRCARSSRIWRSASSIRKPTRSSASGSTRSPSATSDLIAEIEQQLTSKLADRGIDARGHGPAQARLFDLAQDGAQVGRLRAAFRHLRLPRHRRRRSRDCYQALGIVHTTWPMVPGRFKDYISTPEAERLPLDPHHRDRARASSASSCRSAPHEMHEIAEYGIAAHALYKDGVGSPTELLSREIERLCLAAAHHRAAGRRLQPGGVPRAHQARAVPRPGVLLHAEGQADRAAAQGDADRFRLCGAHRRRQHRGRLQDQRPDRAADLRAAATATRSRSSPRRRRPRRRRPGNRSSSPARRAPRSAAPPAPRCARNMPGSAAASSSGCSSAPRSPIPTRSCTARCRGWRAPRSRTCWRRSAAARCGRPTSPAPCIPTTRRSAPPRWRRSRSRRAAGSASRRPSRSSSRCRHGASGAGDPDPRHQRRPAGALCARTAARCRATASSAS